jgi:sugar lactone lactonase YvrE
VMSYLVGASLGTVVAGGNGRGTSSTQLNYPVGIYFESSSNSLIIANAGANNIVRWTLGAANWILVAGSASGSSGSTSTLLNYPVGVISDSTGNVYVADRNNHRIQFFLSGQSTGRTIAGVTNTQGNSSTLLNNPYSMLPDAQLNLYVADTYNHRIQRFLRC